MKNILKTISRFLTGYRRLLLLLLISLSLQDKSFAQVVVNSSADVVAAAPAASANTAGGAVTIRSAIQYANLHPGTTITFAAALNGTPLTLTIAGINENNAATGDLDILAAVTITGNGPANTIIQAGTTSANGIDKVFSINPLFTTAFATNISGITIRFGKNASAFSGDGFGGGLDWEGSGTGTLIINNCVITDNSTADGDGGGMTLTNSTAGGGSATITNSTISNNRPARAGAASPVGGGVFIGTATSVFMTNCTISGNNTSGSGGNGQGGGIFIFGPSGAGGQPSLTNCIISNNTSPGDGGGIISTAPLTINATTFSGNNSGRFGGGLFINHSNATTTISENTFINNNATTRGGAIYLGSSTTANILNVSYSRFVGNTSAAQNGVAIDGGAGTLQNNWWGCNQGPSNAACNQAAVFGAGSINFTPWLVLNHTPSSAVLCSGANTTLTASFLLNSGGGAVAASNLDVLIGLPITFNAPVNGTLSGAQSAIQANGNATVTFTATTAGNGTANAVFVPATENVTVTTSPAITINTCCVTNPIVTTNANAGAGSLRQAVLDACPGSTITFDMAQVTSPILLSDGQLILNKNLTIQGPGANLLTVQNTAAVSATSRVFLVNSGVTASISGLTISGGNLSLSEGGGIKNEGILTVTNSTFSGNSTGIVGNGGAIFSDGTLTVSNSTFINNSASSDGGAIFSNGGTLSDCTFSGNSAPGGFGGAIYAAGNTWSITRSTFTNNSAVGAGGAIYNANISAMITNSTFTSNSSGNAGGAVANVGFQLTMINCSFFGNTVSNPGRGGALFTSIDGPLTLKNSIVASSTNGNFNAGTGGITGVPVTDGGGNLKDDNTGPVTITQVTLAQLALSPIANNGGPTQTIALGTGSVAINAGNNANAAGLTTDQRGTGFPRISPVAGTVDVGAYEFGCINNPVVTNNLNSGAGSLRQAVLDACPGSTITFDMTQVTSPISLSAGQITIDKNLTIEGPGANLLTVQNTAAASSVFIINSGVTATISKLTISGGNNSVGGGGIFNSVNGTVNLTNSTIANNSSTGFGGGIFNNGGGTVTVTNSTISNNSATGGASGGGIFNNGGTVTVTNSTISNNSSTGSGGGGIFNNATGMLTVTNSTISNNSTTGGGGGIRNNGGTVNSKNSIIAGNTAGSGPDFNGASASQGNNLIGKTDGSSGWIASDFTGIIASPLDPLLGALANNGGSTMTHALLPGSPAINTGTNTGAPATDQRGIIRPQQTTTDIGAFESRGFTMTISGGNNQTTVINTAFAIPLVVTVASAFSEPVDGGKVTFTPPASGASSTIAGNPATITGGIATTGTVTANATVGGPYAVAAGASGVSSGVNFSLTNTAIPTTTVITSNLNPSCFGSAVTFTATVTSGGNPVTTGTVNFTEGVTPLASNVSLNGSGQATFITSSLTAGGHTITATYNGTASFATSNGSTGQTVTALPAITLNAPVVIQPTCAVPTGTITVSATTASGLLEYSIDNGVTWQLNPTFNSLAFSSLAPGSYFVRVRLQGGSCSIAYTNNPIVLNVPTCPGKTIPGRIETESFDAKNGPQYGVPTDDAGGGQHVIGITNGSWMDYNVLVTQAGLYTVTFRVATTQNNPQFQIKLGSTVLGVVNITNTGGWSNWVNVSVSNIALTAGSKTIRIQSVNNETCNFNWTDWVVAGANTAPTATAGPNQSIVQPASQVTLAGSGIANNGGSISSHVWSKFSGPAGGNVTDPNSYTTTVTALQVGTYVFRLTVTQDDNQTATSDVTIVVNPSSGKFIPGRVEAEAWDTKSGPQYAVPTSDAGGGQQVIGMNNGAWLDYNVNVTQTGAYTVYFRVATTQNNVQFRIKSGATVLATVNIPNTGGWDTWMSVPVTNVALTAGIQTLRIQQSSNESCNFNWMDWSLTGPTTAPTANAGPNQNIILPITQVTMAGSGTANNPGGFILSHIWSKLSGGTANITDPANYNTTITGLSIGTYVFRLTVNQNDGQTATADVTVTVGSIPAPTVNAGPAQTITLPVNTVTLAGSGAAGAGGTITHVWSKFSGGTASITDPSNYGTTVTGLAAGTYVFRLTVNQNDGQTAFSDVTITVNPAAGNGKTIPGKIEAEAWDAKSGSQYAVPTGDAGGGQQVVGMTNGSWLDYNVNVLFTGSYTVNFRIATTQNNAQFQVKSGATVLGTLNVPNTGGWDTWQTVALNNIALTAGVQIIRIQLSSNESCNFNWTDWVFGAPPIAPLTIAITEKENNGAISLQASVFPNPASSYFSLRVQTKSMEQVTVRIIDIAGRQVQQLKGSPEQAMRFGDNIVNGTYFVEVRQGTEKVVLKVLKQ